MRLVVAFRTPQAENPTACHQGLATCSANITEVLSDNGVDCLSAPVRDGYFLRDKLAAGAWGAVTHVVLSAPFFDTPFLHSLCREFPKIQFSICVHSNVAFLGSDIWASKVFSEEMVAQCDLPNFRVSGNSRKFCDAAELAYGKRCLFLPNLYFVHGPVQRQRPLWDGGVLKIGAFGATRVLKNFITAAWAAAIISRKLNTKVEFHMSDGRKEGSGADNVPKTIADFLSRQPNVELILDHWAPWSEFRRTSVRKMNLLMQPSFTESMNIVTADGIAEGVPSVVSPSINWVPENWMANPDDAVDVANTGICLLRDRSAQSDGYKALKRYNDVAVKAWKAYLQ